MTFEGHVKSVYGELMFQVTALTMQLETALAKNAELETKIKELQPEPEKPARGNAK